MCLGGSDDYIEQKLEKRCWNEKGQKRLHDNLKGGKAIFYVFLKKKFTPKYCLITIQLGGSSEGYIFVFLEHIMKPKNT